MNARHEKLACQLCEIKPDHRVLEVGFGPGIGLKEAFKKVSGGSGSIHDIDFSQKSISLASERLKPELDSGKMKLHLGPVTEIPYPDCTFDSIFHCNSNYYWPNIDEAVIELYRVIKPDCVMVTAFPLKRLEILDKFGFVYGNIDPDRYITSLQRNGFYDIDMKTIPFDKENISPIVARARK